MACPTSVYAALKLCLEALVLLMRFLPEVLSCCLAHTLSLESLVISFSATLPHPHSLSHKFITFIKTWQLLLMKASEMKLKH